MFESPLGKSLGRYEITEFLGQGGMGSVYKAKDPSLERDVAIKVMHPHLAQEDAFRQRFQQEAKVAAKFTHPAIAHVYDVGPEDDPLLYMVMEYIQGPDFQEHLEQMQKKHEWFHLSDALRVTQEICRGLAHAHSKKVLHRDIKPANIMFRRDPSGNKLPYQPVLMDLGLAKILADGGMTQTDTPMGTPAYMSPEQARSPKSVNERSDIYSLGVLLYQLVVGEPPLSTNSSLTEAIRYHLEGETPPPPRSLRPDLPLSVERVIVKAIEKDPAHRFSGTMEMAQNIDEALADAERIMSSPGTAIRSVSLASKILADQPEVWVKQEVKIRVADGIEISPEIEAVLKEMFQAPFYQEIVVKREFGSGLSGGRVFEIRPIETGNTPQLRTIVKVAAISLIQKEWEAYWEHIHLKLSDTAGIIGNPTLLPEVGWGGLRYPLVGGGRFKIVSLLEYCRRKDVTAEQIGSTLRDLFEIMHSIWAFNTGTPEVELQPSYERLLPVNLLLKYPSAPAKDTLVISPTTPPTKSFRIGNYIRLEEFKVIKVDFVHKTVTLALPLPTGPYYARIKTDQIETMGDYETGQTIPSIAGEVIETRQSKLRDVAKDILGADFDLDDSTISMSDGMNLPNPLLAWQKFLKASRSIKVATIHGDFNLENSLVRANVGTVSLIDFAEARRDHVLHDFFRLETEIMTKLIPDILREHHLTIDTAIFNFYEQLHLKIAFPEEPVTLQLAHRDLEKPFAILAKVRQTARFYLHRPNDWSEYYQGLTLYLIGALKFSNLDDMPTAPYPKLVAFWGAATIQILFSPIEESEKPPVEHTPLKRLGKYEVTRRIGKGGMAEVYKANHPSLARSVAVKVIHHHYLDNPEALADFVKRFKREANTLSNLKHSNIVQIHDFDPRHNPPYMVMEFIDGPTLQAELKRRGEQAEPFTLAEIGGIFKDLTAAIDYAHAKNVIHRDLKPGNIMFARDGKVMLTDFGIARLLDAPGHTLTGAIIGTAKYISPEQAQGKEADRRSDIYSLGVILYEMVTGQLPFAAPQMHLLLYQHIREAPPPPREINPDIPAGVEAVILKALHKDPEQRYQTAGALAQALAEAIPESEPQVVVEPSEAVVDESSTQERIPDETKNTRPEPPPVSQKPEPPTGQERILDAFLGIPSAIVIAGTILLVTLSSLLPWMLGAWWLWLLIGIGAEALIIFNAWRLNK